jgi:hypothetical protein
MGRTLCSAEKGKPPVLEKLIFSTLWANDSVIATFGFEGVSSK